MPLIVGLGNPGPNYAGNRHNIGFMAADAIVRRHRFSPWKKKFDGLIAEGEIDGAKTLVLKPMTYMNLSGQSVGPAARFYKIAPSDLAVIYDEIDLAPGKIRVKIGGGSGGHNGIRSIDDHLEPDYWRVRLGVGHPGAPERVKSYVLQDFATEERPMIERLIEGVAEALPLLIADMARGDANSFMNKVNLAVNPPPPRPPRKIADETAGVEKKRQDDEPNAL